MGYFESTGVVLQISGRHAERYLQARLTNDVRRCVGQTAIPAAALTPQGKTEVLGQLLKSPTKGFFFLIDGGDAATLTQAISRFKVAEQVDITVKESLKALHLFGEAEERAVTAYLGTSVPSQEEGAYVLREEEPLTIALRRRRSPLLGLDIIAPATEIGALTEELRKIGASVITDSDRTALRLEAGIPTFPEDLNETVILSEAQSLEAVSFTKGCYTGQEVIAKIDSLGKPPRRIIFLEVDGTHRFESGAAVTLNSKTVGRITSSAYHAGLRKTLACALLKNDGTVYEKGLSVGGIDMSARGTISA